MAIGETFKTVELTEEEAAFLQNLYFKEYDKLYMYAKYHLNDSDCEDMVQDTFLLAALKISCLMESEEPVGWLKSTLKNIMRNNYRQRKILKKFTQIESLSEILQDRSMPFEEDVQFRLSYSKWFSEEEWEILYQYYCMGHSGKEVSVAHGLSEAALRMKAMRLKKRLLAKIKQEQGSIRVRGGRCCDET